MLAETICKNRNGDKDDTRISVKTLRVQRKGRFLSLVFAPSIKV